MFDVNATASAEFREQVPPLAVLSWPGRRWAHFAGSREPVENSSTKVRVHRYDSTADHACHPEPILYRIRYSQHRRPRRTVSEPLTTVPDHTRSHGTEAPAGRRCTSTAYVDGHVPVQSTRTASRAAAALALLGVVPPPSTFGSSWIVWVVTALAACAGSPRSTPSTGAANNSASATSRALMAQPSRTSSSIVPPCRMR